MSPKGFRSCQCNKQGGGDPLGKRIFENILRLVLGEYSNLGLGPLNGYCVGLLCKAFLIPTTMFGAN